MANKETIRPTDKDYQRLGKAMRRVMRADYFYAFDNKKRFFLMSFSRGLMIGLGTVIGATLVLGILVWLLSLADNIPWIGRLFENIRETIQQGR